MDSEVPIADPLGGGVICVPAIDPGGGGDAGPIDAGGGSTATCAFRDQEIPCQRDGAYWMPQHSCYAGPMSPQPSPASTLWGENDPASGAVWTCLWGPTNPLPVTTVINFFVPATAAPLPDPAVLAQRALDTMQLATAEVNLAPAPPDMTYVGLETWLWVPATQWAPLTESVTAGTTTVTVTAVPQRVTWDLGAGTTTCTSPGRAWSSTYNSSADTDCSFTYDRVSSEVGFPVTATLVYRADWTCAGACLADAGSLDEVDGVPGVSAIRVSERQSVVIG
ncbi:hypothetical protein RDV89_17445 [Nocardioides zeae]|uniref:PKD domain-containing protein n=1 Tax=Nocardioides imazamoxiresistens TaxID=3231893 RepID=A0ABU3Q041_9ACTN|nr:hypothetical protein [Nocardioides zeae]MDT9594877.1 hypothetical protein [Nocardioides zeae]